MTLEAFSWLGIFVIGGGFLVLSAWIFETHPADPISPDRRDQAHLVGDYVLPSPSEPAAQHSRNPRRGVVVASAGSDGGETRYVSHPPILTDAE